MTISSTFRSRKFTLALRPLAASLAIGLGAYASPALATCTADVTGLIVTCTGTSGSYSNGNTGVSVDAQAGGTVTGPMVIGNSAAVTNSGAFTGTAGSAALTVGTNSTVTIASGGSLTTSGTTAGSEGVVLGDFSTLTNNGTLSGPAGFNIARFGVGGTFINNASAPAVVTGNVAFGPSIGANVSTFTNNNTAFGFTGNVTATGNLNVNNAGKFTGGITQTAATGTVNIQNVAAGTFTGSINTGDSTVVNNAGTMTLTGASLIGQFNAAGTSFTNSNVLNLGSGSARPVLNVNGNFVQTGAGKLGVMIGLPSTTGPVAGSTFSQVRASGTATLGGTLALTVTSGYYPTNSLYNVVVGDQGVSGNFSSVTGNVLTFITFTPVGVVTLGGTQQAYQLRVDRTTTYAAGIATGATANQIAVANGFQPLVAYADTHQTSDAAALVGSVDVLTAAQAQTFFDSVSPAGYLAYANSMRDHASLFQRQVALRMHDHNSDQAQKGWWLNFGMQALASKATGTDKTKTTGLNFAGGYDFSGPSYLFGLAAGYSHGSLKYGPGTMEGKDNAYQIGAYAQYSMGPLFVGAIVDYQFGSLKATKTSSANTITRAASADTKSKLLTASGRIGADLDAGPITFRPFVGVEYNKGSIDGFTETGAGAANLIVSKIDADRTDLLAGATLTRSTGRWRPYVKGTYRSLIGTAPANGVTAAFIDIPTSTFTVTGRGAGKTEFDVDAGLNWVSDDEGGLYIAYQGTYRNDITSHGIVAGIRLEF
ncbi:MAG: autotransporter domain-containing protein [Sphingomonadaceae bacterium]